MLQQNTSLNVKFIFPAAWVYQVACISAHINQNQYPDGVVSLFGFRCCDSYIYRALRRASRNRSYGY
jgi:hypothetical protein